MEERGRIKDESTPSEPPKPPGDAIPVDLNVALAIRRAFPGLRLTRALGLSFDLGKVILAAAGIMLLQVVWGVLDGRLLDADWAKYSASSAMQSDWVDPSHERLGPWISGPIGRLTEPARVLIAPLLTFLTVNPFDRAGIHAALCGLATVAVWGLIGGAIARMTLVRVGWGRSVGPRAGIAFAVRHARPLVATPILPIVVLLLAGVTCAFFGLVFKLPWIGNLLGGLFLILPIALGLLMFVLAAGLAAGWPLMVASVAAEGEDELDALSRSFSYLNHRLGRYASLLFFAFLIGIPGLWLANLTADGTLAMTRWGVGLTAPRDSLREVFEPGAPIVNLAAPGAPVATVPEPPWNWFLPAFWIGFVRLLARAWAYSYFWTSISVIYLLIRKDVDGAEWSQLKPDIIGEDSDAEDGTNSEPEETPLRPAKSKPSDVRPAIPLAEDSAIP